MYKPNISFKSKKWVCNHCGLLKDMSKSELEIGDEVFFKINHIENSFEYLKQVVNGTVLDKHNCYLIVLEKSTIQTYFIHKNEVHLKYQPEFFLYNMYGKCICEE